MTKKRLQTNISDISVKNFFNDFGYRIGQFKEGIYRKEFKPEHIMRKYNGLGIDTKIINELKDLGCYEIRARNVIDGVIHTIAFKDFQQFAIPDNMGYGNQLFCPMNKWKRSDAPDQLTIQL